MIGIKLLREQTLFVKGKVKGIVQLQRDTENNQYTVFGELYEDPRLQCEKSFRFKLIALCELFWLKRQLQSTYTNKELENVEMKIIINKLSIYLQTVLWLFGYSWHNSIRDECTPDFSCCAMKCKESFKQRWMSLPEMWRESRKYRKCIESENKNVESISEQ